MNIQALMKQAQNIQKDMQKQEEEIEKTELAYCQEVLLKQAICDITIIIII